jgi:predicted nucleic acid-binding protein
VGLIEDLGRGPIGLDTAVLIYLIQEHPRYAPVVEPVFSALEAGRLRAVTSSLTLLEVLVVPLRSGDDALAESYERILTGSRGLHLVDLDRALLRAAAQLRARHAGLRTPDALQLAAALASGCKAFVTNDRRLPPLVGLRVVQLADYL